MPQIIAKVGGGFENRPFRQCKEHQNFLVWKIAHYNATTSQCFILSIMRYGRSTSIFYRAVVIISFWGDLLRLFECEGMILNGPT
jgi:hypothetical protein